MTLATLAPVSGNQTGIWIVIALGVVLAIAAVLWQHEVTSDRHDDTLADHTEQLAELAYQIPALLEFLDIEISEPVADDSPEAMAAEHAADPTGSSPLDGPPTPVRASGDQSRAEDPDTDEFPAIPCDTAPMAVVDPTPAVQARRDAAWDVRRPSPVPRKSAEWVEAELERIRARSAAAQQVSEEAS